MLLRSLLLALTALAVAVPAAGAESIGDRMMPIYDAADGVRIVEKGDYKYLRFGPKAAGVYKRLAGKRVEVACGKGGDGAMSSAIKLPRKRSAIVLLDEPDGDLCAVSTKRRKGDRLCLPTSSVDEDRCARVIVAQTDAGRAHLDELTRMIEIVVVFSTVLVTTPDSPMLPQLQKHLGPEIVELPTPDAAPGPGQVGVWTQGEDIAIVTLLRDGTRRFSRWEGDVYSTNVPGFKHFFDGSFSIF